MKSVYCYVPSCTHSSGSRRVSKTRNTQLTLDKRGSKNLKQLSISLHLTSRQVEEYYRGKARHVVAEAVDGRIVQLPINVLHSFISEEGIIGDFVVTTDDNHKFVSINRLKTDQSDGNLLDQIG